MLSTHSLVDFGSYTRPLADGHGVSGAGVLDANLDGRLDLVLSTYSLTDQVAPGKTLIGFNTQAGSLQFSDMGSNQGVFYGSITSGNLGYTSTHPEVVLDSGRLVSFRSGNTWSEVGRYDVPGTYSLVGIENFDGDGLSDLVLVNAASGTVSISRQQAGGSFSSPVTTSFGSTSSAGFVWRFDNDQTADLLVMRVDSFPSPGQTFSPVSLELWRGTSTGQFVFDSTLVSKLPGRLAGLADVNGDGRTDVLFQTGNGSILSVYVQNSNRGLTKVQDITVSATIQEGIYFPTLAPLDYTGDGRADLAIWTWEGLKLYTAAADGTLSFAGSRTGTKYPYVMITGDFDGNGRHELVVPSYNQGRVSVDIYNVVPTATAPGAPTNVTGTAGNGQVSLTWSAPASNGGAAITDYVIQFSSNSGSTWTTFTDAISTTTSTTVTGLTNGTGYVFRVAAANSARQGSYSTASSTVIPAAPVVVPGAPANVTAAPGNAQVVLTWTAPASNGGSAITDYLIQYSSNSGSTWTTFADRTSQSTSALVTGLENDRAYVFRVAATSSTGAGSYSGVSNTAVPSANQRAVWSYDSSFGRSGLSTIQPLSANNVATSVDVDQQGRVVVAGMTQFASLHDGGRPLVARLLPTGAIDTSFGTAGIATPLIPGAVITSIKIDASNRVLLAGSFMNPLTGSRDSMIARLTANGALDTSFSGDGILENSFTTVSWSSGEPVEQFTGIDIDSRGRIVLGGFAAISSTYSQYVWTAARVSPDGAFDTQFSSDGLTTLQLGTSSWHFSQCWNVFSLPGDKLALTGQWDNYRGNGQGYSDPAVAVLTSSGELDGSFGANGSSSMGVGTSTYAPASALDGDGKFIVGRTRSARFGSDGSIDRSYGADGIIAGGLQSIAANASVAGTVQFLSMLTGELHSYRTSGGGEDAAFFNNGHLDLPLDTYWSGSTSLRMRNGRLFVVGKTGGDTGWGGTSVVVAALLPPSSTPAAPVVAPGAPANLTGLPGNGQVSLTWSAPASNGGAAITDYVIQFSSNSGSSWTTFTDAISTATSTTVTGLANGTGYVFRVAAVNSAGQGSFSTASSTVTPTAPVAAPGAPTSVTGTAGNGQVSLTWTAPASTGGAAITDYIIQFSSNSGSSWTTFTDAISTATSTTVTGLTNGTGYIFRVAAANSAGQGGYSTASSTVTPTAPVAAPGAPTNVTGTAGNGQVSLTWTAPASTGGAAITDYVIQFSSNSGSSWTTFTDAISTATSTTVTGLTNGTGYVFRVAAANSAGQGSYSTASSTVTPTAPVAAPGAPTNVTGTPGNGQVSLTWSAPASTGGAAITDYVIQFSSNAGSSWTTFTDAISTATSTTVTGLTNGTGYVFRVAAVNSVGQGSFSASSTQAVPSAPSPDSGAWIYWTNDGKLFRGLSNGSQRSVVITPSTPDKIISTFDIDFATGRIFYGEEARNINTVNNTLIYSAALDGTDRTLVYGGTKLGHVNFSMTVDTAAGYVFLHSHDPIPVTEYGPHYDGKIQRIRIATGEVTALPRTFWYVHDLQPSAMNDDLYVAGFSAVNISDSRLYRTDRNGSRFDEIAVGGIPAVNFALAETQGAIFVSSAWGTSHQGRIYRLNLSNGTVATIHDGSAAIYDIEYDPLANSLYWYSASGITRSHADGTGVQVLYTSDTTPSMIDGHLAVVPLPGIPTAVIGTSGSAQVSLTWTPPAPSGGLPITDYVIQYSSNAGSTWTTFTDGASTATSTTVTGLTHGTSYLFRVAAVNSAGQGAYSTPSAAVTPAQPPNVAIESHGSVALSYDWQGRIHAGSTPVTNGGATIDYNAMNAAGWRAIAAEPIDGTNTIVWRHSSGNLHFWRLSGSWSAVRSEGWQAPGSPAYFATETSFGMDFDNDGTIGSPFTVVESAGSTTLAFDKEGRLFAGNTLVTLGGQSVNYSTMMASGWQAVAAEQVTGTNTLVWRHSTGNLHFWRLSATWSVVST